MQDQKLTFTTIIWASKRMRACFKSVKFMRNNRILISVIFLCVWNNSYSELEQVKAEGERTITANSIDDKRIVLGESITQECLFAGTHEHYKIKEAKNDARRNFYERSYYIYSVGNGLGPNVPASKEIYKLDCKGLDIKQRILWVGSDSLYCKNHSKMESKAYKYAKDLI